MARSNFIIWAFFWVRFPRQIRATSASTEVRSNTVSRQFRQLHNNNLPYFAGSYPKHQNRLHVSQLGSMGARAVVFHPAPLLFSWQKRSLSAELKAESVWHRGYICASYQSGSMREECLWFARPNTLSNYQLVISPCPHLSARNTYEDAKVKSNDFSPRTSGKMLFLCAAVRVCVFAPGLQNKFFAGTTLSARKTLW